jgi:hypothetical protein
MIGASPQSIGRDLGTISTVPSGTKNMDFGPDFVPFGTPPAIPPDNFDPIEYGQPKASQRAIADMIGVSNKTIGADLGEEYSSKIGDKQDEIEEYSSPTIPPDDFDPVERERKERQRIVNQTAYLPSGSARRQIHFRAPQTQPHPAAYCPGGRGPGCPGNRSARWGPELESANIHHWRSSTHVQ